MKRSLLLSLLLLIVSASLALGVEPLIPCEVVYTPAVAPVAPEIAADPDPTPLLEEIFEVPAPHQKACNLYVRCPSGLYMGCPSGTTYCETWSRYCLMCDGTIYRCQGVSCPL